MGQDRTGDLRARREDLFQYREQNSELSKAREKNDPDGEHEFPVTDTAAAIFMTVMNLGQLNGELTVVQSVFQLWWIACNLDVVDRSFADREMMLAVFGNLS